MKRWCESKWMRMRHMCMRRALLCPAVFRM